MTIKPLAAPSTLRQLSLRLSRFHFSIDQLVIVRQGFAGLAALTLIVGFVLPLATHRSLRIRPDVDASVADVGKTPARSLNDYLQAVQSKTLFQGDTGRAVSFAPSRPTAHRAARAVAAAPAAPAKPRLADLAADLQLSGILNDGSEAVVTNKKTQETLYVTAGQHIGDIAVTSVKAGGITLSYDGQTLDLAY